MLASIFNNQKKFTFVLLMFISTVFLISQNRPKPSHEFEVSAPLDRRKFMSLLKDAVESSPGESEPATAKQTFTMEHCQCQKSINASSWETDGILYNETTCGRDAYRRGKHQKVIGFSFYGDLSTPAAKAKGYFEGIKGNLELMSKYYPGWVMRVYYDLDDAHPVLKDLCDLACKSEQLDICHAGLLPGTPMVDARKVFAMNWRFFPTLDPQVDALVSRDLDSRLNSREWAAVQEWLAANKSFHFMRDHPGHGTTILGSGWGVRFDLDRPVVREHWRRAWKRAFKTTLPWRKRTDWGPDQIFLGKYIWNFGKHDSVSHDSYHCKFYGFGAKGFPVQRPNQPNNFVAAVVNEGHTLWEECPIECRRDPLWTHC